MSNIYSVLSELKINYEKYEHPAVFTVEAAEKYDKGIKEARNKSIFLRNKKGESYYLVVTLGSKRLDLKGIATFLGESKLSFGSPEKMMEYLGLTPGSVSPFGLINDVNKKVIVIIDEDLMKYKILGFHPNINTATLIVKTEDFKRFLELTGNNIMYKKL